MRGRIQYSVQFRDDIDEIWAFIADDDINEADKFIDSFEPIYDILAKNPHAGKARPEIMQGLRSFPHRTCVIFYFPTDDGVLIYRVLHSARDIQEIFADQ